MDATFFCFVVQELASRIRGLRLEKVFCPLPETWTFELGRAGYLLVGISKPEPFLFLSAHKPDNPPNPSGQAMWLRKRLRSRKVLDVVSDWPRRRLALELSTGEGRWLLLDLTAAPRLVGELPPQFGAMPVWPEMERIVADRELWRELPHLTPPLRRFLAVAGAEQGRAVLDGLQRGQWSQFHHGLDERGRGQARLWPFPGSTSCSSALEAAQQVCGRALAGMIRREVGVDSRVVRARKRLVRALARLEEDRIRLTAMVELRQVALWLQGHLHQLDKHGHLARIAVVDAAGEETLVQLDPRLSLVGNMARFFDRAAKGERGLGVVAARMTALRRELANLDGGRTVPGSPTGPSGPEPASVSLLPARYRQLKVAAFRSSDGFLLLRGRNAQANHQLLTRAASPFDYWLHAQDGPGAHVILKRDFATQAVPEQTLLEAACLAALASHLKMSDRGDVLVCLVRDVRTIKGAAVGMVEVGKVLQVMRPTIDPAMEERLAIRP